MATVPPRIQVTQTRELAAKRAARRAERRKVLEQTRGVFGPDVYPPGYLEELRKDWAE